MLLFLPKETNDKHSSNKHVKSEKLLPKLIIN